MRQGGSLCGWNIRSTGWSSGTGGVEIRKNGQVLYCNLMPLFVTVKTNTAINVDYSGAYHAVRRTEDKILAEGILELPSGSSFRFEDFYGVDNSGFWMKRKVQIGRAHV